MTFEGEFWVECRNPDGSLAWWWRVENAITLAALTDILSVQFASGTQKPSWYMGLIDNANFSGLATGDTMSSHAGWTESTAYSQSTRPQWSPTVGGGVAINGQACAFSFTAAATVAGLFIVSNSTKGGSTGSLWSTGLFAAPRAITAGQTFRVSYSLRAAGGG